MITLQFVFFLNCICIGILTGFVSDLTYLIKKLLKKNYIASIILDFCVFFVGATIVFLLANKMNNNIFTIFEPIGFVLGVLIEKISCSNLIAKFFNMLYNSLSKAISKIKLTKFGQRLAK